MSWREKRRRRKTEKKEKREYHREKKAWVSEGHNIEEKDACTHSPLE